MAVAADMVMSPFGKRSQLYERLQSGEVDRMRQRLYRSIQRSGAGRAHAEIRQRAWTTSAESQPIDRIPE